MNFLAASELSKRTKKKSLEKIKERTAYTFIAIPVLYFIITRAIPTVFSFFLSFMKWDLLSPVKEFVKFENYQYILQDSAVKAALLNTFEYVIVCVPIMIIISVILALLLNQIIIGKSFYRLLVFIPYVTSIVAISWVWKWMFMANGGVINTILKTMGLPTQQFLNSTSQSMLVIMTNVIWQSIGFNTIIVLAGLMQIPKTYYEAAEVDGANAWQKFVKITIPQLNPTFVYIAVMGTIRTLQVFTQVYNIAGVEGGPLKSTTSLVLEIYLTAFKRYKMGRASAITVLLFIIIMIITIFQMKVLNKETD